MWTANSRRHAKPRRVCTKRDKNRMTDALQPRMREAWEEVETLLSRLKVLNAARTVLPAWYEDLLRNLVGEVGFNFVRMMQAHKERHLAVLAYSARNLLELYVWAKYCVKSEGNARRFREDMFRDFKGIYEAAINLSTVFSKRPDTSNSPATLRRLDALIRQKASAFGMSAVDSNYTRALTAAGELGLKSLFVNTNTLLSKVAHPTALIVLTFPEGKALDGICDGVAKMGLYFVGSSIVCISQFIRGLGVTG